NPNANGAVRSIAVQADGKILIGGDFTTLSPNGGAAVTTGHLARVNSNGTVDTGFNPNANDRVSAIVVQADGKILVGGRFNQSLGTPTIGGATRNRIARLDATTGAADTFNPNANSLVVALAVQDDGKILVGGNFSTLAPSGGAAVTRNNIARLEIDGRLDRTLNLLGSGLVRPVAIQPDGKILIGGNFGISRLNPDGTLDTGFNPNANDDVYSIAVQADGKILVGGAFRGSNSIGGQRRYFIARLDATTGLADTFNPAASSNVRSIVVQVDGKILVGGDFSGIGGQTRFRIARLDPTTGLADSFNPSAD